MEVAKIAVIAIIATLLIILLKDKNPVFAVLTALTATAVMVIYSIDGLREIFIGFQDLFEAGGIEPQYYKSIIKVIGIAYFTEIISSLCRDAGEAAIAQKLELSGRIAVLMFTMPVVSQLMSVIIEALNLI